MSYIQGYDPHTLREIVDVSQCRERLGELGDQRSLPALLERVWLLKVTGEFDEALAVSEQSVRVRVEDGRVVIEPLHQAPLSLAQRLAAFDPALHGGEAMPTTQSLGAEQP